MQTRYRKLEPPCATLVEFVQRAVEICYMVNGPEARKSTHMAMNKGMEAGLLRELYPGMPVAGLAQFMGFTVRVNEAVPPGTVLIYKMVDETA